MIFLSVGTQLPFNRLVQAVDEWASKNLNHNVFAQIGESSYKPKHLEYVADLDPDDYANKFREAQFIVSHVGMGSIISGLSLGKNMLMMPRKAALGEHRTDHQLSTARKFSHFDLLRIIEDENEFSQAMDDCVLTGEGGQSENLTVSNGLTLRLTSFLNEVRSNSLS